MCLEARAQLLSPGVRLSGLWAPRSHRADFIPRLVLPLTGPNGSWQLQRRTFIVTEVFHRHSIPALTGKPSLAWTGSWGASTPVLTGEAILCSDLPGLSHLPCFGARDRAGLNWSTNTKAEKDAVPGETQKAVMRKGNIRWQSKLNLLMRKFN